MEQKINEIEINGIKYIPKDLVNESVTNTEGLRAYLVRSYAAGVHFGYIKSIEDTLSGIVVTLINTRRVWSWCGAASLSQMAIDGVNDPDNKCKFSVEIPENKIIDCIEIIPLTKKAFEILKNVPVWKI